MKDKTRVGIIGARGYIGQTLIDLLDSHPKFRLTYISSRELAGKPVPNYRKSSAVYEELSPADVGMLEAQKAVDCWVLALPNGLSGPYLAAIDIVASRTDRSTVVVDLSADHRFDSSWTYGLAELVSRTDIARATRIANPGCFATAAQLALAPISKYVGEQPTIFGVSGYSGAGTKPSPKNDLGFLKDNVVPYGVTDHIHEREISARLGYPISLIPHVSSWFQGILLSINVPLNRSMARLEVDQIYRDYYSGEKLVHVVEDTPLVRQISGTHGVDIGGFAIHSSGKRLVVSATVDNLNKGGATQCLRKFSMINNTHAMNADGDSENMNIALGYPEYDGIPIP